MDLEHPPLYNEVIKKNDTHQVIQQAREAFQLWSAYNYDERKQFLKKLRTEITNRIEDIAAVIHQENGKTYEEGLLEVFSVLHHTTYVIKRLKKVLKPKKMSSGFMINYKAEIQYQPMGVILVLAPWNMPFYTPFNQIIEAIAAGNSIVLKSSEVTPGVADIIKEITEKVFPAKNMVQVVHGGKEIGINLVQSNVNKIVLTGRYQTGQSVMRNASENLTPLLLELGGKDPMIVLSDADLDIAAQKAAWGAFSLAGQACISVERCYVMEDVFETFLNKVVDETKYLKVEKDIPKIAQTQQVDIIVNQVQDALSKGARLVFGALENITGNKVPPMIMVDVTEDMLLMKEETFGPVLAIIPIKNAAQAVEKANNHDYALGASVFGKKEVSNITKNLRAGMVSINSMWVYTAIPALPFGGFGKSGFGQIHGDQGILEFCHPKSVVKEKYKPFLDLTRFRVKEVISSQKIISILRFFYGKGRLMDVFKKE
ncbi:aldehyde dehydrogenase family protein [Aquimarina sp. ERC-38]|uniref:aldehyde dehydrogenase family protein n=1 Tax=Aquimarina sp. ERC-38 TaxID=2949996 RepID=UPI002245F8EC|nr:aldehyde dehydrogenase family protein [Aquimarina sp. ERC-38]UZO82282.1 aldehyde dehydrogenase family protein [Aquimarina sp. ERC-38]